MQYLLDTNTFIEAKNVYYRFSFCPGYWDWILQKNQSNTLFSIDKIKAELLTGNDELTRWTRTGPANLFINPMAQLPASLGVVAQWVDSHNYTQAAKDVFYASADYYLISYAHVLNYTVVTREVRSPGSRKRVKIPDVCDGVGVSSIDPFQLLENEHARLISEL